VLDKMIRALRPGGWLLLEEADGFPLTARHQGRNSSSRCLRHMGCWTSARTCGRRSLTAAHLLPSSGASESRARATGGSREVRPVKA
jgi:hypothetical protein